MADPPTGTVTFLFTDIRGFDQAVGTGRSCDASGPRPSRRDPQARHRGTRRLRLQNRRERLLCCLPDRHACARGDPGGPAGTPGRTLETDATLKIRMALHTGTAVERDGDYFGPPVNRVARLLSIAHGGQMLLSFPTHEMVCDQLPAGVGLEDMGERRLRDLSRPERVFQLTAP